ncbi:hypothetical protein EGH24_13760 [Halonotius terrestris]|uniref:Uncharacterized protein n=1 Tax=Halonotius terrestris TaxID=2487750 RepID=A0A8J8P9R3_9EURY|nr:hypothetical protein [Halonotius terrestris]TQQ78583.1 hypothetical protein EGH24_13760 [Halonotius terrestris]
MSEKTWSSQELRAVLSVYGGLVEDIGAFSPAIMVNTAIAVRARVGDDELEADVLAEEVGQAMEAYMESEVDDGA